jgi:hypothetical protein
MDRGSQAVRIRAGVFKIAPLWLLGVRSRGHGEMRFLLAAPARSRDQPKKMIRQGTGLRFLRDLRKELRG